MGGLWLLSPWKAPMLCLLCLVQAGMHQIGQKAQWLESIILPAAHLACLQLPGPAPGRGRRKGPCCSAATCLPSVYL